MSRMSELSLQLEELRRCGEALIGIADSLRELFGGDEAAPPKPMPEVKLEDVRGVLAEKSRAGYRTEVKELLKSHGADRLSQVEPRFYRELIKEAEAIGNGS